jgi:hypothetical protein
MDVTDTVAAGLPVAARGRTLLAGTIGTAAIVWFTTMSGWLGVTPGTVLMARQNVLFNSDTNTWIDEMVHQHAPSPAERVIHPLDVVFWRGPCQAAASVFARVLPRARAELLAARLLVAVIAGAGVGMLAWVALTAGLGPGPCVLLFTMYLLFTASSTIALPEHFGISSGLLSIAFSAPIAITSRRVRTGVLAALVPVCGGTTLTNVLYPLAGLFQWGLRSVRARRAIVIAAVVALPVALFLFIDSRKVVLLYTESDKDIASRVAVLPAYLPGVTRWYLKTTKLHGHVVDFLNLRLVAHPADAVEYAAFALVAPAVGPSPEVRRTKGQDMVTYESGQPLHWNPNGFFTGSDSLSYAQYSGVQAAGALLWIGLLLSCAYCAFRDPTTRRLAWLPGGWILFNLTFHNVWGDELFLYAPHWSWALMALVALGARHLSRTLIASLVIPIAMCQVHTLLQIRSALLTIVQ